MEESLKKIESEITETLKKLEIVIDSISFEEEKKINYLNIVLDKINGIDLDTIVEATRLINPIVDKYDESFPTYILDVSSKEKGEL